MQASRLFALHVETRGLLIAASWNNLETYWLLANRIYEKSWNSTNPGWNDAGMASRSRLISGPARNYLPQRYSQVSPPTLVQRTINARRCNQLWCQMCTVCNHLWRALWPANFETFKFQRLNFVPEGSYVSLQLPLVRALVHCLSLNAKLKNPKTYYYEY